MNIDEKIEKYLNEDSIQTVQVVYTMLGTCQNCVNKNTDNCPVPPNYRNTVAMPIWCAKWTAMGTSHNVTRKIKRVFNDFLNKITF